VIVPLGASPGNISATVNDISASSEGVYFSVIPTITEVIPDNGSIGDTIVIIGNGFNWGQASANLVWFTNGWYTTVISASPTSVKVIVPIGSTTGPIYVSGAISSFDFTVIPAVISLGYYSGEIGTNVTIYGSGFDPDQLSDYQVTFNGITAEISYMESTFINTFVPQGASSGPVEVRFKGEKIKGPVLEFIVNPIRPAIYRYSVDSGTIGTPVTIIGKGFDQAGPPLTVHFGEVAATIYSYSQDTINTIVPRGAVTGPITVTSGGLSEIGTSFNVLVKIDSMSPRPVYIGDTVTVYGSGFNYLISDYYQISFYNPSSTVKPISVTDSTLNFAVPLTATSTKPLLLSNYNLLETIELPYLGIKPVIHSMEPDTVITGRRQTLTFLGTGFGRSSLSNEYKIVFTENIDQKSVSNNPYNEEPDNGFIKIWTRVPNTAVSGPVSLVIDGLVALSPDRLVVLPDTFPYTPEVPDMFEIVSVRDTSFTCQWSKPYRALGFLLDLSTDNFNTNLSMYNSVDFADTVKTFTGLDGGTEYQFRMRSFSDTDTSIFSYPIRILTIPSIPVADHPIVLDEYEYLIEWSASKGAEGYIVDLSIDGFKTFEPVYVTENYLFITVIDTRLPSFQFRVRAYNTTGISDYSNTISILITGLEAHDSGIHLFPNPSINTINIIGFANPITEVTVSDNSGRVRKVNILSNESNLLVLDIHELPSGSYFLKLVTSQSTINLKFIKN
jgi:hypothetical protein